MRKSRKSFRIGTKSNKLRVLLSVPKLIIIAEGIPTPDDVTRAFPMTSPVGNLKITRLSTSQSSYMHANSANKSGTI